MNVVRDVTTCQCAYPDLVLTIGSFDGVHLGHQKILATVKERARARGGTAGLMSLWPHPRAYFHPEEPVALLTDPAQKESLLEQLGLDVYFVLPFSRTVASLEPLQFLREIVVGKCGATHLVVGHDFSFGAGARGNFALLKEAGPDLGLSAEMVDAVELDGERVSSTRIRAMVCAGDMAGAQRLLGRPYSLAGMVERGRGLGHQLGFPTANIVPAQGLLPALGIYAARVNVDGRAYLAAVNVGIAPTVPHDRPVVEAHLLDFDGPLDGQRLEVELHWRLRPEKRFESMDALKDGIQKDIVTIRQFFQRTPA
jgi:riboflavin kinase/FMN adenylyltransferase